jgi:5'-methylthioadenosine phosphorylase
MHRLLGGDLIGMTAMPEAKLAREAELPYALVAMVTDYDCWKTTSAKPSEGSQPSTDPHVLLKEIIRHLQLATQRATALLRATVELIAREPQRLADCPASRALQLGIWSDRDKIDRDEVRRLAPLWGRYLSASDDPVTP